MSGRLRTLRAGTSRTAALARDIRFAAGGNARKQVNHIRVTPDGVTAWDWRPAPLYLSPAQQRAVAELMHATRPDIDWTVAHDYSLTRGMLRRSPAAGERGHDPAADGGFGGSDPVFLPRPADGRRAA
jgi:hypothetical protein